MEIKLDKNKSANSFLLLLAFIMLIFIIGGQFYEKLQTNAFMDYSVKEFNDYEYNGIAYELPVKWISEIDTTEGLYKNTFENVDDKLYGSFEIVESFNISSSNDFLRSNITVNGIDYVLLENKTLSEDGIVIRNFNYYTGQDNKAIKICFSSYDKNAKENITLLFEDILSRIKF